MLTNKLLRQAGAGVAVAGLLLAALPTTASAQEEEFTDEQYFGIPSIRVGPYNVMGTGYYAGELDYLTYVNMKGGVNGVKLTWEQCETEYNAAKNVECYQRLMTNDEGQKMLAWDPYGTPLAYAVIGRVQDDQVVLAQAGFGRTDAAYGPVWPWVFGVHSNYWTQIAMKLNFIQQEEGGIENMKGKTIAHLYIDTAYGREPLPAMRTIAENWGFRLLEIPIAAPGLEQQSQWRRVRRENVDWVTFWGAGAGMSGTAHTTRASVGFPANRVIFVTFGGAEEDMIAGGDAATGTYAVGHVRPGKDIPLIQDILKVVYGAGKGDFGSDTTRVGTMYYNRGVAAAVNWIEAMRIAQEKFDKVGKAITGEEFRWGYEHLDFTSKARRDFYGIDGLIPPFRVTCEDHEGGEKFLMMQWNGEKYEIVRDWMGPADPELIDRLEKESALKFAEENNKPVRDCSDWTAWTWE
jgi:branched-chain amino acid transport system substrate-binding protein